MGFQNKKSTKNKAYLRWEAFTVNLKNSWAKHVFPAFLLGYEFSNPLLLIWIKTTEP